MLYVDSVMNTVELLPPRYISKNGREIAEDATQIFGGRALTVTGMGKLVENVSLGAVNLSLSLLVCFPVLICCFYVVSSYVWF